MNSAIPRLIASVVLSAAALLTIGPSAVGAQQPVADSARTSLIARADLGRIRGQSTAPVWIVVISDFQCPFCKRWHEETAPALERNYVRTGKAQIAYLHFPINTHRNAQPAHELAMCAAEQDRFWPTADKLFATQSEWKSFLDPMPFFDSLAATLPLDQSRLRACLASGTTRALIRSDYDRSVRVGVGSTPSFLIGGTLLIGAQPYEAFAAAIDAALLRSQTARP